MHPSHRGSEKWRADDERAVAVHRMASGKPGSIWPSQAGIGVSKDVWMLGIGLGLVLDGFARRHRTASAGQAFQDAS